MQTVDIQIAMMPPCNLPHIDLKKAENPQILTPANRLGDYKEFVSLNRGKDKFFKFPKFY